MVPESESVLQERGEKAREGGSDPKVDLLSGVDGCGLVPTEDGDTEEEEEEKVTTQCRGTRINAC